MTRCRVIVPTPEGNELVGEYEIRAAVDLAALRVELFLHGAPDGIDRTLAWLSLSPGDAARLNGILTTARVELATELRRRQRHVL